VDVAALQEYLGLVASVPGGLYEALMYTLTHKIDPAALQQRLLPYLQRLAGLADPAPPTPAGRRHLLQGPQGSGTASPSAGLGGRGGSSSNTSSLGSGGGSSSSSSGQNLSSGGGGSSGSSSSSGPLPVQELQQLLAGLADPSTRQDALGQLATALGQALGAAAGEPLPSSSAATGTPAQGPAPASGATEEGGGAGGDAEPDPGPVAALLAELLGQLAQLSSDPGTIPDLASQLLAQVDPAQLQQLLQPIIAGLLQGYTPLLPGNTSQAEQQQQVQQQAQQLAALAGPLVVGMLQAGSTADLSGLLGGLGALRSAQGVVSNLLARMRQPPVTLLFNASSYHAFMAAYTDIHQALANIDLQAMGAGWGGAVQADWPLLTSHGSQGLLQLSSAALTGGNKYSKASRYLRVANHPLPLTHKEHLAIDTFLSILAAIFCMIPFCYLAGAYCVSPVTEGRNGARALQVGAGCPRYCYWAGSLVWDLAMHGAVSIVSLATFAAFGDASTTGSGQQALATLLLLFGFGCGCVPLTYCMSLGFDSPSAAQARPCRGHRAAGPWGGHRAAGGCRVVSVSAINFVLGFIFVVGSQTMQVGTVGDGAGVGAVGREEWGRAGQGEGGASLSARPSSVWPCTSAACCRPSTWVGDAQPSQHQTSPCLPRPACPTACYRSMWRLLCAWPPAGEGLINLSTYNLLSMLTKDLTPQDSGQRGSLDSIIPDDAIPTGQIPHSPFQWDMVGRNLAALYGSSLAFFLLLLLLDAVRTSPAARSKAALAAWALIVPLPYALWLGCALPLRALLRALPRHRRPRAVSSWPLSFKDDLATHLQLSHIWGVTWLRSHGALLGGQKSDLADPSHLGQAGGEGVGYREGGEEERESDTQALLPPLSSRTRLQRNSLSRPLSRQEGEEGTSSHTVHITASGGVGGGAAGRGSSWGKQGGQAQQPGKSGVQGEGEEEEDVDVREERRRVEDRLAVEQDALCIRHLSK
ncbi:hypothetical protein QJQ45_023830, partial [Haematococcus lacustris]